MASLDLAPRWHGKGPTLTNIQHRARRNGQFVEWPELSKDKEACLQNLFAPPGTKLSDVPPLWVGIICYGGEVVENLLAAGKIVIKNGVIVARLQRRRRFGRQPDDNFLSELVRIQQTLGCVGQGMEDATAMVARRLHPLKIAAAVIPNFCGLYLDGAVAAGLAYTPDDRYPLFDTEEGGQLYLFGSDEFNEPALDAMFLGTENPSPDLWTPQQRELVRKAIESLLEPGFKLYRMPRLDFDQHRRKVKIDPTRSAFQLGWLPIKPTSVGTVGDAIKAAQNVLEVPDGQGYKFPAPDLSNAASKLSLV